MLLLWGEKKVSSDFSLIEANHVWKRGKTETTKLYVSRYLAGILLLLPFIPCTFFSSSFFFCSEFVIYRCFICLAPIKQDCFYSKKCKAYRKATNGYILLQHVLLQHQTGNAQFSTNLSDIPWLNISCGFHHFCYLLHIHKTVQKT